MANTLLTLTLNIPLTLLMICSCCIILYIAYIILQEINYFEIMKESFHNKKKRALSYFKKIKFINSEDDISKEVYMNPEYYAKDEAERKKHWEKLLNTKVEVDNAVEN